LRLSCEGESIGVVDESVENREGEFASKRFFEIFTVNIRNANTRQPYGRAVWHFMEWCDARGLSLATREPIHVAAYIEKHSGAPQTVKQHLAGIWMLFDWLVIGQVVRFNPAAPVRGPRHSYRKGKTPVLSAEDARALFDSIDVSMLSASETERSWRSWPLRLPETERSPA
jgi:integrase/recombinase XerD